MNSSEAFDVLKHGRPIARHAWAPGKTLKPSDRWAGANDPIIDAILEAQTDNPYGLPPEDIAATDWYEAADEPPH